MRLSFFSCAHFGKAANTVSATIASFKDWMSWSIRLHPHNPFIFKLGFDLYHALRDVLKLLNPLNFWKLSIWFHSGSVRHSPFNEVPFCDDGERGDFNGRMVFLVGRLCCLVTKAQLKVLTTHYTICALRTCTTNSMHHPVVEKLLGLCSENTWDRSCCVAKVASYVRPVCMRGPWKVKSALKVGYYHNTRRNRLSACK